MAAQRKEPNRLDPLSEPTLNRRMWGAYLHRGFTRYSFAKAMGAMYKTVDDWDTGKKVPQLDALMRASMLLDFSLDELCFGRRQRRSKGREGALTRDEITSVLRELRVTAETAEALAEHERSAAGQYQLFTRSYVTGFVVSFARERRDGVDVTRAIQIARDAALAARMLAEAVSEEPTKPITKAELAELGAAILVEAKVAPTARTVEAEPKPRPKLLPGGGKTPKKRRQRA